MTDQSFTKGSVSAIWRYTHGMPTTIAEMEPILHSMFPGHRIPILNSDFQSKAKIFFGAELRQAFPAIVNVASEKDAVRINGEQTDVQFVKNINGTDWAKEL